MCLRVCFAMMEVINSVHSCDLRSDIPKIIWDFSSHHSLNDRITAKCPNTPTQGLFLRKLFPVQPFLGYQIDHRTLF